MTASPSSVFSATSSSTAAASCSASGGGAKSSRRKKRCWTFHVTGIKSIHGAQLKETDVLSSFRERYTAVKRLVLTPTAITTKPKDGKTDSCRDMHVVVQFTGPQPSQGPGALLCNLLSGTSVDAQPVELGRGRKKKRARSDSSSSEASDSDVEEGGAKKTTRHGCSCTPQEECERDKEEGAACFKDQSNSGSREISRAAEDSDAHDLVKEPVPSPPADDELHVSSLALSNKRSSSPSQLPPLDAHAVSGDSRMRWDDVVRRVYPPTPSREFPVRQHSLDLGGMCMSISSGEDSCDSDDCDDSETVVCDELTAAPSCDPSLVAGLSSTDPWVNASDLGDALLGPTPTPNPMKTLLSSCFNSGCNIAGGCSSNSIHTLDNDLDSDTSTLGTGLDEDSLFNLMDEEPSGVTTPEFDVDAKVVAAQKLQEVPSSSGNTCSSDGDVAKKEVAVETVQTPQECDFDGNAAGMASTTSLQPFTTTHGASSRLCYLAFVGLEAIAHDLQSLTATVNFYSGSSHRAGKVASPIQLGPSGRTYAAVFYPSMDEIWPEVYSAINVRIVEVDMIVEVRSRNGEFHFVAPKIKVTYKRPPQANQQG